MGGDRTIFDRLKALISFCANNLNPLSSRTVPAENITMAVTFIFIGLSIFQFFAQSDLIHFLFSTRPTKWGFMKALYALPVFALPVATFMFWNHNKIGWIFIVVFSFFSLLVQSSLFYFAITWNPSGLRLIDATHNATTPSMLSDVFGIIFYAWILWLLSGKNVRKVFGMYKRTVLKTGVY
jgi:hypothetical protein